MLTITVDVELKCDNCGSDEIRATLEYDLTKMVKAQRDVFLQAQKTGWDVDFSRKYLPVLCPCCANMPLSPLLGVTNGSNLRTA